MVDLVDTESKLLTLAEARDLMTSLLACTVAMEHVPLAAARNRILAEDLTAPIDLPRYNSAAVDGFAVRHADLAAHGGSRLRITGQSSAGHPFQGTISQGEAVRILTGAMMPAGADTVVMQEDCRSDGEFVLIPANMRPGTHCRHQGEDVRAGSVALCARSRLRPYDIALAAALGHSRVAVFSRLRVALFSTGDEVQEPGNALASGEIWDANRWLLRGLLETLECRVTDLGILPDSPLAIESALSKAAQDHDLLITSGGMSVGSGDHVSRIVRRRGTLDVWQIAVKPGKPVGLGDIDACPILALPGNPVAAAVTYFAFGRSVVQLLAGALDPEPPSFRVQAGFHYQKKPARREYLLGKTSASNAGAIAVPMKKQGAAMLSAMTEAQGFIVLDENIEHIRPGDVVEFAPFGFLTA